MIICNLMQVLNHLCRLTLIVVALEYLVSRGKLLRRNRFMNANFALIVVTCSLSAPSIAQDENDWQSWPLVDHFTVELNAMFPSLDTRVRVDASDQSPGTSIIFEQNLGMPDTETLPALGLSWRFAKKHQLNLNLLRLDRSGSAITTSEIRIGDKVFTVDLPIASFFDMQITSLRYSYSFILDERKELALGLGLSIQDLSFGVVGNGNLGVIEVDSGVTAPIPTFGLTGGYAFTDKWLGKIGFGYLSFDLALDSERQLSGDVLSGYASLQHNTFERVHFGLSYQYFDVKVNWSENGLYTSVGYEYYGPVLTVTAAF
jgi:hypothetical protein